MRERHNMNDKKKLAIIFECFHLNLYISQFSSYLNQQFLTCDLKIYNCLIQYPCKDILTFFHILNSMMTFKWRKRQFLRYQLCLNEVNNFDKSKFVKQNSNDKLLTNPKHSLFQEIFNWVRFLRKLLGFGLINRSLIFVRI